MKQIKAFSFQEIIAQAQKDAQDREDKLAAMTPEERVDFQIAEARRQAETEEILAKLGVGGPVMFNVRGTQGK